MSAGYFKTTGTFMYSVICSAESWKILPGWVVGEQEGRPVGVVVALEVLHDHVVHTLGRGRVTARVSHAAPPLLQVIPHHQRQLPDS